LNIHTDERFYPASVFARIKSRLSFDAASPSGDHILTDPAPGEDILDGLPTRFALAAGARAAAVLVGLVAYPNEVRIIFTQRAATLRVHPGQIAFPGGKMEPHDESPIAAAVREAQEEIGLPPSHVEPLGYLNPYLTGTGFRIIPVVAKVLPCFVTALDPGEVEDTFEAPFAFLMDAANHTRGEREIAGQIRQFYAMPYGDRYIWGITAGILRNLYERLYS
jgi:8-oxo-dGTP pyrophosphatase MutT (NUDIX family)